MDAHHNQVARRRAELAGAPPRRYFAYSTILDTQAFDEWRTQHEYLDFALPAGALACALDVELTYDFPSRFWGGRVAGLADRVGARVWGVVYEIAGADWPIIEHKEGAVTRMTQEREVRVRIGGTEGTAVAFTTRPERASHDGEVSTRFIDALVRGATHAGLPADYIASLKP